MLDLAISQLRLAELNRILTRTEKVVLNLLVKGYTRNQITEALNMSPNTVRFHVRGLFS
ncbi:LuxR C-terminal-related transcriptional regulator [Paenibacillus paeoniae]|uniref:DNA-binding response regulator n=1 Tax=Paenibacillus paeoniae TaxID=2292705 RepID=A0A371PH05_9BACL|nr:DNA-binding response regulator [Paenibacillus paeoniae]